MPDSPEICPVCGNLVPSNSPNCPECGADHETGWSELATAQQLGISDDEFDYDEFVENEFGDKPAKAQPQIRPHGIAWLWWIVALLLAIALLSFGF